MEQWSTIVIVAMTRGPRLSLRGNNVSRIIFLWSFCWASHLREKWCGFQWSLWFTWPIPTWWRLSQAGNQIKHLKINTERSFLFSWYFKNSCTDLVPVFGSSETSSQLHMTGLSEPTPLKAIWEPRRLMMKRSPHFGEDGDRVHVCAEGFFCFSLNTVLFLASQLPCL